MNADYFLKQTAKKVIFYIFIIPIIIQLILINTVQAIHNETLYYILFLFFGLLYLPYFYWLNTIINYLFVNSNKYVILKIKNFRISLVINIIAVFNFVFFVAYIFNFFFRGGMPNTEIILCMVSIQFIGVVSFAYNAYFVSKLIAIIELKREVYFSDISATFITLSIPPIAVWVIHNRAKKIFEMYF